MFSLFSKRKVHFFISALQLITQLQLINSIRRTYQKTKMFCIIQVDEIINTTAQFYKMQRPFPRIKQEHCTKLKYYSIKLSIIRLLYSIYLQRNKSVLRNCVN